MKLILQVLKDLRREIVWLALYGVLASAVLMSLPGLLGALSSGSRQQLYETEEQMRRSDLTMILTKGMRIDSVPEEARVSLTEKPAQYTGRTLRAIMEEGFSREGKLGCYAVEYDESTGRPKYVYFVGKYVDLAPVEVPQDSDYYICCTEEKAELVGKTVTVFGEKLPVSGVVSKDAMIYHPVRPDAAENLSGALFVFIRDYQSLRKIFWYSHDTFLNDNLIAVGADKAELAELLFAIDRETGQYAYAQTMKEYLGASTQRMQAYTSTLFKLGAIFALIAAMLLNISRAIRRWEREYSIHRLFGATQPQIFSRMLLFGLGYNLLPIAFLWYKTLFPTVWSFTYYADGTTAAERVRGAVSHLLLRQTAGASIAVALTVCAVCTYEFIRFQGQFTKGMRGE